MISCSEFDILHQIIKQENRLTRQQLSKLTGMSIAKINAIVNDMLNAGLLTPDLEITSAGRYVMEPYRVKNAVIMAAGMSSRFAPLSYEKPKALLKVKGEILIEREIRQLQEAGIYDITLVVGYMKEKMFYLADKYNLDIVVNEDYYRYNNTSTLILVADKLDNTYICSSDNYFTENPFEKYVYRAYYAAVYAPGATDEYCLTVNRKDRITHVDVGGSAAWYMLGHVYFDREFSKKFVRILRDEYSSPITKEQLWENLYMRYIDELDLYIKRYSTDVIKEFDSLDELREFDKDYLKNTNSKIFTNICKMLECKEEEIVEISPIKSGLTNLSFKFSCKGTEYVYRHPGVGTEAYINRHSEAESMQIAKKLGLDDTFIYIDNVEGWKLSYYIQDAQMLDYHNASHVSQAMKMLKKLHLSKEKTTQEFNIYEETQKFIRFISQSNRNSIEDMEMLQSNIERLYSLTEQDGVQKCICHCDSYNPNFLVDKAGKMYLIDWEYSGMSDPGCDIGTFIACSDYTMKEAEDVIAEYLGYIPQKRELRHWLAYVAIVAFYWFVWALYQECMGKNVGEYMYIWYRYTKQYSKRAIALYEEGDSDERTIN